MKIMALSEHFCIHMSVYNFTINYEICHITIYQKKAQPNQLTEAGKQSAGQPQGRGPTVTMTKQNDPK